MDVAVNGDDIQSVDHDPGVTPPQVGQTKAELPIGDALDPRTFIGPLITEQHADAVRGYRERAVESGDAIVVGEGGVPPPGGTPVVVGPLPALVPLPPLPRPAAILEDRVFDRL